MGDEIFQVYKRVLLVSVVIIASLFIFSFILSSMKTNSSQVRAETSHNIPASTYNSPNVITNIMSFSADKLSTITGSVTSTVNNSVNSIGSAAASSGKFIVNGVGNGISSASEATGKGIKLAIATPGNIVESVSGNDVIGSVIRPDHDETVPIIDPNSPQLLAALASLPPAEAQTTNNLNTGPVWPMKGRITAEFGERHRPYQQTHTGMDISNGQPSGTTPINPFRPGRVIKTVHSRQGLGNHVIVDHGSGVTSVYAHLSSIAVSDGQEVNIDTTLGFVGSTGMSTGPHLHFEIRVNGQAANPKQFIGGNPG